jgi:hypothetical protein
MGTSRIASVLARAGMGVLAGVLVSAPLWAYTEGDAQLAVWTPKELRFVYQGFTTRYSCEGLRTKVRDILLTLGARKQDLQVHESGCAGRIGAPDPFPAVSIKANVLMPAAKAAASQAEPPVTARWQSIDLLAHHEGLDAAGQCELFEQVKQQILPLFTVRNLDYTSTCVPHQLTPGGQRLKAEVLVPDQAPAAAK